MATLVQSAEDGGTGSSGTITVSLTGVAASNLIVLPFKWEGGSTTATVGDGTSSLTVRPLLHHTNGDLSSGIAYLLAANSGNKTMSGISFKAGAAAASKLAIFMAHYE